MSSVFLPFSTPLKTHSQTQTHILSLKKHSTHQQRRSTHPGWSCGDNVCAVVEVSERRKRAVASSDSS